MSVNKLTPIHPGEILKEEFLIPLGISQNMLGRDLGVPPQRINEIVRGVRSITIDTALRLAKYFETTPEFWLNLQSHYDLEMAEETHLVREINREVRTRTRTRKVRPAVPRGRRNCPKAAGGLGSAARKKA
jgi:addiction module HigA family antidote